MSNAPTYVPTQMAAPMPAAPVAPVPVKRPLTITPPPEEGANASAAGASGTEEGEGLPQRAGGAKAGGGRRYSAKTGGLSALD